MKVTTVASPQAVQQPQATDKRSAAIAAFEASAKGQQAPPQAQEHPVANPNKISPEETSVVLAPKGPESLDKTAITEDTQDKVPEKDPEVVKQFAEIARQERILRAKAQKQQQELADARAALDAEKAALATKAKEYEDAYVPKSRLKLDPLGVLEAEGLSYDELTQRVINQQPKNPVVEAELQALRNELKALRTGIDESKQSAAQQQAEAYQQAVAQLKTDATKLVASNPEEYEAIAKSGAVQDVVDLIEEVYRKDKIVMSVEEAAKEVENYLIEEGFSFTRINKIQKRLAEEAARTAPPKPVTPEVTNAKPEETQTAKTLTNNMSSTRKLSARERAIAAMEGRLK